MAATKPADCPNPIPEPVGADYAVESFAAGSGLAKLTYLKNSGMLTAGERQKLDVALFLHTVSASYPTSPMDAANMELLAAVAKTCELTLTTGFPGRYATSKCHDALEILTREAGGKPFADYFAGWLDLNKVNFGFGPLDLQTVVSLFAPENSLSIKWKKTQEDAACSSWWNQVQQEQCGVP